MSVTSVILRPVDESSLSLIGAYLEEKGECVSGYTYAQVIRFALFYTASSIRIERDEERKVRGVSGVIGPGVPTSNATGPSAPDPGGPNGNATGPVQPQLQPDHSRGESRTGQRG